MVKKLVSILLAIVLLLGLIAACSSDSSPTGPVAIVDGTEITREAFEAELEYMINVYQQQGMDLADEDLQYLREHVVDQLINMTILLAAAEGAGITMASIDVEAELAIIRDFFDSETEFLDALALEGYNLDSYTELLAEQLMIQALFEIELDLDSVELTDEEMQELIDLYDEEYAEQEDAPAMDEVIEYFTAMIIEEKTDAIVMDFIEGLRNKSSIEYLDF